MNRKEYLRNYMRNYMRKYKYTEKYINWYNLRNNRYKTTHEPIKIIKKNITLNFS